jgi:hypothetical protein
MVNSCMTVIYNSYNYCVIVYPVERGYEIVDKQSSRGTYFDGIVADKFRESLIDAIGYGASFERVDEFLSESELEFSFPMTIH